MRECVKPKYCKVYKVYHKVFREIGVRKAAAHCARASREARNFVPRIFRMNEVPELRSARCARSVVLRTFRIEFRTSPQKKVKNMNLKGGVLYTFN